MTPDQVALAGLLLGIAVGALFVHVKARQDKDGGTE